MAPHKTKVTHGERGVSPYHQRRLTDSPKLPNPNYIPPAKRPKRRTLG
jgi:hypothetical protein